MPSPFYPAIKGTTSGAPGTSAFTPNAAATGRRAWSTVPTGWIGPVRFDDASNAWEESWCYWDGTSLSRSATQLIDSSTGSALSLTSAATASMIIDPAEVMSHLGTTPWRGFTANPAGSIQALGTSNPVPLGTSSGPAIATTNMLTEQVAQQHASATTPANSQCGWPYATTFAVVSSTAGRGGWELVMRWGATQLPTGPRLFAGMTATSFSGNAGEPSALTAHYALFGLDSTDTNIQLLVNSNVGSGTKTDTGIPWVANGLYEGSLWTEPGSTKVYGLLIRLDTGAIWYGSTTTDVPATGTLMTMQMIAGLSATTGTALNLRFLSMMARTGI